MADLICVSFNYDRDIYYNGRLIKAHAISQNSIEIIASGANYLKRKSVGIYDV